MLKILHKSDGLLIAQTYDNRKDMTNTKISVDAHLRSDFGFNLGLHVDDKPSAVLYNRSCLLKSLGYYGVIDQIVWLNQVHGNCVYAADTLGLVPVGADALVASQKHIALAIMTADCVPIAIWGIKYGKPCVIGCIHAGWQGLVAGIIKNTAVRLSEFGGLQYAYIGACIGQDSYEVDRTLAQHIVETCVAQGLVQFNQADLYQQIVVNKDDSKAYLDIGKLATLQLESLGVKLLNESYGCTYTGQYYSHRQATHIARHTGGIARTGRMAMIIAMT